MELLKSLIESGAITLDDIDVVLKDRNLIIIPQAQYMQLIASYKA